MLPIVEHLPDHSTRPAASSNRCAANSPRWTNPIGLDKLRYFSRRAEEQYLFLPLEYAEILKWVTMVSDLVKLVDAMEKGEASPVRALLFYVRAIMRSVRFQVAVTPDQAMVILAWVRIEKRFSHVDKAVVTLEEAISEFEHKPDCDSMRRYAATMEMSRAFYRYRSDKLRNMAPREEQGRETGRRRAGVDGSREESTCLGSPTFPTSLFRLSSRFLLPTAYRSISQ